MGMVFSFEDVQCMNYDSKQNPEECKTLTSSSGPLMAHMKNHAEHTSGGGGGGSGGSSSGGGEGFSPVSANGGMQQEFEGGDKAYINDHNSGLVEGKPYCCNLCDYTTTVKGNLARHLSLHVEAKEIYKCHLCAFSTSQKISLSKHFRSHR